jgi:antitoxin ParD1/3/4
VTDGKNQIIIDSYPWAVPIEEQKRMFNGLSQDQQLKMLQEALIEGEESGDAGALDMENIRREAKKEAGLL